jgi:hypothetical protein
MLTKDEHIRYSVLLAEPNLDSGQIEELEYLCAKNAAQIEPEQDEAIPPMLKHQAI